MAEDLFAAMRGEAPQRDGACLLRLDALAWRDPVAILTFSGGVAEYLYGREQSAFCDLGPALAGAIRSRTAGFGAQLATPAEGIRATAIGAAQYTTQLSGSTVFIAPQDVLPLRNVPVLAPALPLDADTIEAERVAEAITHAMQARELTDPRQMVALFVPWRGSATFARLDGFCRGVADAFSAKLAQGIPLVLAGDGDVGGLIGMHLRAELGLANALVSIDGIELKEFDFIDIGALLDGAGAVPVVIKSLLFPAPARDTSEHAHG
jgi:ethanolamine utilization protein EutA